MADYRFITWEIGDDPTEIASTIAKALNWATDSPRFVPLETGSGEIAAIAVRLGAITDDPNATAKAQEAFDVERFGAQS